MSKKEKIKERRGSFKVRFSIGAKLITIISIIVLISLGSITALVSWLVREDLKLSAEENNFEVNRRATAETEQTLERMRLLSLTFTRTAAALGERKNAIQEEADYFFAQNPQIAALFYTSADRSSAAWMNRVFVNERFFLARGIETSLADAYRVNSAKTLESAAMGQTALLNASPWFNKGQTSTSLAAMFFPIQRGGGCVLFSSEDLNESFGMGVNASYLINADGGIVADADPDRVKAGVNLAGQDIIRRIFDSSDRNKQMLVELDAPPARRNTAVPDFIVYLWENVKSLGIWENVEQIMNIQLRRDPGKTRYYLAYTKLNIAGCTVITSIEYDKVFEGINATTRRNLYLTAAILFLSTMCIWFFAKSISVPLKALASAARTIEGGVFDVKLRPASRDEIGMLTASFGKMCSALGIFGKFTNRNIAIQAMRGHIKPGGLSKHATIFFSDIRGFTEKSENFVKVFGDEASDRIVFWLNEYLTRMVECVEKTGGTIDKFIGDAVMAHWGTASTSGSARGDALNCVKTALLMRVALHSINKNRKQENWGNPPISIGCGINTGIVTAGQIGSDLRMEYTVIGDPVNLASRVEALNKPLGTDILITEDTWDLIKDQIIVEEMPAVTVKGKEKPVRLFAVVNLVSVNSGPRTLAQVRKALGINPPDISKADVNAEEHKYKIGGK
jgi:adenylate cyclase